MGFDNLRPLTPSAACPAGEQVVDSFLQERLHACIFFKSDVMKLARDSRIEVLCNDLFPAAASKVSLLNSDRLPPTSTRLREG
jgi:hypothetical protein